MKSATRTAARSPDGNLPVQTEAGDLDTEHRPPTKGRLSETTGPTNGDRATVLRHAYRLQKLHVAVLPIQFPVAGADRSGKAPATRHGVKDATAKKKELLQHVAQLQHFNLAVATGTGSGLICIDVDPRHGGSETLKRLIAQLGPLGRTWKAKTGGGGVHYFFRHPDIALRSDTAGRLLGKGVDVLTNGAYAVVPPSVHASGRRYAWVRGRSPKTCPLGELPESWLKHLLGGGRTKTTEAPHTPPSGNAAGGNWQEGGRNNQLTKLAGKLHAQGVTNAALKAALLAENAERCEPPLPKDEVARIAASIGKRRNGFTGGATDLGRSAAQALLDEHYAGGDHLVAVGGQLMAYKNGVWSPLERAEIERQVLELIPEIPHAAKAKHATLMREVVELVARMQVRADDPFRRQSQPHRVINCRNGEVWLLDNGKAEFRPHNAASFLEHQVPVDYDPDAQCLLYDGALAKIFGKAQEPEELIRCWHEIVGYIIQPDRPAALILVLQGRGSNGKTRLMETVNRLLGTALVYAGRIDDLTRDRFTRGYLRGKLMFLDDDVQAGVKLPDGQLKQISERKLLTGEVKFRDKFEFECRVVPVLLCNNVPTVADLSHGMLRRLQVIPFDRRFTNKSADPTLFDRIWATEMSGVLNRAIAGWQRLQARAGKFKPTVDMAEAKKQWMTKANPFKAFLEEKCEKDNSAKTLVLDLYNAYTAWTREAGVTLVQQRLTFKHNLEHEGYACRHTNRGQTAFGLRLRKGFGI